MSLKQKFLKLIGHKYDSRYTWGEFNIYKKPQSLGLEYCPAGMFAHNTLIIKGIYFSLFLHLPTKVRGDGCMTGHEPVYGFYTIDNSIVFRWGQIYKSFDWPWFSYNWEKTEVLDFNRVTVWEETVKSKKIDRENGKDWFESSHEREIVEKSASQTFDYQYVRKSGEIQHRKATVHVERMTWGRKWFSFAKLVRTSIDVSFDEEIGERVGGWKGGTTQCGWELKNGETPEQALRRMEIERKFE